MKHHKINTIQDIINIITPENIDSFLIDFRKVLESAIHLKSLGKSICDAEDIPEWELISEGFLWIDDGENKIKIELKK